MNELLNCPFCNCKPLLLGFEESKEKYNTDIDQCTIHCPGCGIDMKELRKDGESEDETYERLFDKWHLRDTTLGVDFNKVNSTVGKYGFAMANLLGKQKEIIGLISSFSDPSLDDDKYDFEYRHRFIMNEIKELQSSRKFYKNISLLLITIIIVAISIIKLKYF